MGFDELVYQFPVGPGKTLHLLKAHVQTGQVGQRSHNRFDLVGGEINVGRRGEIRAAFPALAGVGLILAATIGTRFQSRKYGRGRISAKA